MSASREKKARQELNESGYVDPRKAREAEEKAKERRSTRIYTAVIVAFVLLGVVLFASGRIQAGNEAKETARIGAESAVTIDGEDFSVNDVAYYYGSIYNTFANNGSSFGFDSSKSAREQQYTEGKTWHDYFLESALDYMKESVAVAHAAEAAGFDGAEQMDSAEQSNLSMIDLYASYSGATRAQYLTAMFGKYMTEEAFVRCVRRDALASAYQQSYSDSLTYSAADLQAAYDEDPDAYCSVTSSTSPSRPAFRATPPTRKSPRRWRRPRRRPRPCSPPTRTARALRRAPVTALTPTARTPTAA